jgi:hypothetical protein
LAVCNCKRLRRYRYHNQNDVIHTTYTKTWSYAKCLMPDARTYATPPASASSLWDRQALRTRPAGSRQRTEVQRSPKAAKSNWKRCLQYANFLRRIFKPSIDTCVFPPASVCVCVQCAAGASVKSLKSLSDMLAVVPYYDPRGFMTWQHDNRTPLAI